MDLKASTYLRGHNTQSKLQIASLTKMYTLHACLTINNLLKIPIHSTYVRTFETGLGGTSARLHPDQFISLVDLYYGLMLPSGNDAAHILACYYGCWLLCSPFQTFKVTRKVNLGDRLKCELYYRKFVQYMNSVVVREELKHKVTHF